MFGEILVGETPVADSKALLGKRIGANFMSLTNDFKRQHISLNLAVTSVKDGRANTMLTGYDVAPGFLKRLIRRGRSKISDSFLITTQDDVVVRIKPVLITQSRVSAGTSTLLRLGFKSQMKDLASKETFSSLAVQFLDGRLQRHFRQSLSKIAVLKHFELKSFLAVGDVKESDVLLEGAAREQPVERVVEPVVEAESDAPVKEAEATEAPVAVPKKRAVKKKAVSEEVVEEA
jgi:ribosomal protein S3AE